MCYINPNPQYCSYVPRSRADESELHTSAGGVKGKEKEKETEKEVSKEVYACQLICNEILT